MLKKKSTLPIFNRFSTLFIIFFLCFFLSNTAFLFSKGEIEKEETDFSSIKRRTTIDLIQVEPYGKIESETEFIFSRLPASFRGKVPQKLIDGGLDSSGLYFAFETDAKELKFNYTLTKQLDMPHMHASGASGFDLYQFKNNRWEFVKNSKPSFKIGSVTFFNLSQEKNQYILLLPLYNRPKKLSLMLTPKDGTLGSTFAFINPFQEEEIAPIIIYGTSINHGCSASRPGISVSNRLRFWLKRPIINLGFSGAALTEKIMSDYIAQFDSEILIIDSLWNMGRFSKEEIKEKTRYLINLYHQNFPNSKILLVGQSMFTNEFPTQQEEVFIELYEELIPSITNLYYLPGNELIGSDTEGTVDGVHPNDIGLDRMSWAYFHKINEILGE